MISDSKIIDILELQSQFWILKHYIVMCYFIVKYVSRNVMMTTNHSAMPIPKLSQGGGGRGGPHHVGG